MINFQNPFFIILASCGLLYIILGYIMLKYPPKSINSFYGYRTPKSMKNQETWNFAQNYGSKKMTTYGISMLLFSLLGFLDLIPISPFYMFAALFILILASILIILEVEIALKKRFYQKE